MITADPFPSTQLYVRENRTEISAYSKRINKLSTKFTNSVNLNIFTLQKRVTNFVFLQFSGDRRWYFLYHTSNAIENNFECVEALVLSPEGNRSSVTVDLYDRRWVHNIQSMFMQFVTV
jgi:hypothetical protein